VRKTQKGRRRAEKRIIALRYWTSSGFGVAKLVGNITERIILGNADPKHKKMTKKKKWEKERKQKKKQDKQQIAGIYNTKGPWSFSSGETQAINEGGRGGSESLFPEDSPAVAIREIEEMTVEERMAEKKKKKAAHGIFYGQPIIVGNVAQQKVRTRGDKTSGKTEVWVPQSKGRKRGGLDLPVTRFDETLPCAKASGGDW